MLDLSVASYHAVSDKKAYGKRFFNQLSLTAQKAMIILLIIGFLTLASVAFLLKVRYDARALPEKEQALSPPAQGGLFLDSGSNTEPDNKTEEKDRNRRMSLIERARAGDIDALKADALARDAGLYEEILDALIDSTERHGNLPALVNCIAKSNNLRASRRLAERVIQSWKLASGRRSTIEMLHIAALSDDAEVYAIAVEMTLEEWRSGKLSVFRAEELIALVESQYWLLGAETRRSSAGYALKLKLADVRRDLAVATPLLETPIS